MMKSFVSMKVLYLEGDPASSRLISAAMTRMGIAHELGRPHATKARDLSRFQAVLISDYQHLHLIELEPLLVRAVCEAGLGLLMFGGPKSFGRGGYAESPLGSLLPVELTDGDDRINLPSGLVIEQTRLHPVLRGIDWNQPVVIAGYNRFHAKPATTTILHGRYLEGSPGSLSAGTHKVPLLVVKEAQETGGRVAALAADLAPPWSGGWTQWGQNQLSIGDDEEIGESYAIFLTNLVRWLAGEETIRKPIPLVEDLDTIRPIEHRCRSIT